MSRKADLDNIRRDPAMDAYDAELAVRDRLERLDSMRKSKKLEHHLAALKATEASSP